MEVILGRRVLFPSELIQISGVVFLGDFSIRIHIAPLDPSTLFPSIANGGWPRSSLDLVTGVLV
jgi:hypothetical protein